MNKPYQQQNWWRQAVRRAGVPTTNRVNKPGSYSASNAIAVAVLESECAKARAELRARRILPETD